MKRKNILIGVLCTIVLVLAIFAIQKPYSAHCINKYIELQGIKDEEILSDTGLYYVPKWGDFRREIVLKDRPDLVLQYSRAVFYFGNTFNPLGGNKMSEEYKKAGYYVEGKNGERDLVDPTEGSLDFKGNFIKPFSWR